MNKDTGKQRPVVSAVIATSERPAVLLETINSLLSGSRLPDKIIIVATEESDLPNLPQDSCVETIIAGQDLTKKRNIGIERVQATSDILLLVDDDIIFHTEYLENMVTAFEKNPNAVLIMGKILKNGDISLEDAKILIEKDIILDTERNRYVKTQEDWGHVYGANMAFRSVFFEHHGFDERLPLYGMMEDVDIGTLARRAGHVGYHFGARCVHLRYPGGRISHKKLGFSEVMNPVYLAHKGSIPWNIAIQRNIIRKPISNIAKFVIYRKKTHLQQLQGNLVALANLIRGNIEPEKVRNIK